MLQSHIELLKEHVTSLAKHRKEGEYEGSNATISTKAGAITVV
jgi:hypothetical protein